MAAKKTWLSHSGIELLERCPRCFWLQYNRGIYQPEGIVSRLANRFDGVIKKYFDIYRQRGILPPLVEGKVQGKLENPFQEIYFYSTSDQYGLKGKLDECLVTDNNMFTPVDHKTSSSDPRTKNGILSAYQTQLDMYAFLLQANGKQSTGIGHLIYFYPDVGENLHQGFPMVVHVETLNTNPLRAREKYEKAIEVLQGPFPQSSKECPFCFWRNTMNQELGSE